MFQILPVSVYLFYFTLYSSLPCSLFQLHWLLLYFCFCFLVYLDFGCTTRLIGLEFPRQVSDLHSCSASLKSKRLDHQGSSSTDIFYFSKGPPLSCIRVLLHLCSLPLCWILTSLLWNLSFTSSGLFKFDEEDDYDEGGMTKLIIYYCRK